MSRWDTVLYYLQRVCDKIEGDAHLLGLGNLGGFVEDWKKLVGRYSKMPGEYTTFYEGTTGDFLYFQTEVFTSDKMEVAFFETALARSLRKHLIFNKYQGVQVYSFADLYDSSCGRWRISIYFSTSDKQLRKLQSWYSHQKVEERDEYLQLLSGKVVDKELEEEFQTMEDRKKC